MKLLRVLALLGATTLVVRMLLQRTQAQLIGMSHPSGSFQAGGSSYSDASSALASSHIDEQALLAGRHIFDDGSSTPSITEHGSRDA